MKIISKSLQNTDSIAVVYMIDKANFIMTVIIIHRKEETYFPAHIDQSNDSHTEVAPQSNSGVPRSGVCIYSFDGCIWNARYIGVL